MNPNVRRANDEVWSDRSHVRAVRDELRTGKPGSGALERLAKIADRYDVDATGELNDQFFDDLLVRVDVVPASLVLAQAANESAWGASRFAREGNNFFGIWCFKAGCGLKPQRREAGTKHEVKVFKTVKDGITYYIHTINTGSAYLELRKLRAVYRQQHKKPTGFELAGGLTMYSQRGDAYVKEIRRMIRQNQLAAYSIDRAMLERE
ncbi:MAG: glucosaminidase domain-containing protein [Pseudomonadales bacterium]